MRTWILPGPIIQGFVAAVQGASRIWSRDGHRSEDQAGLAVYLGFKHRPHPALDNHTPKSIHRLGQGGGAAIADHVDGGGPGTPLAPPCSPGVIPGEARGQRQTAAIAASGLT